MILKKLFKNEKQIGYIIYDDLGEALVDLLPDVNGWVMKLIKKSGLKPNETNFILKQMKELNECEPVTDVLVKEMFEANLLSD